MENNPAKQPAQTGLCEKLPRFLLVMVLLSLTPFPFILPAALDISVVTQSKEVIVKSSL